MESINQPMNGLTSDAIKVVVKVHPSKKKNEQGYYINDIQYMMDTENLPFTSFDQTDNYIDGLLNYCKDAGAKDQTLIDKTKQYFINEPTELYIYPFYYPSLDKQQSVHGGKRPTYRGKSRKMKKSQRKSKRRKNI